MDRRSRSGKNANIAQDCCGDCCKDSRKEDISGLFIPGGLFLGLGLGFLFDHLVAYAMLGLGIGFVLMALARLAMRMH